MNTRPNIRTRLTRLNANMLLMLLRTVISKMTGNVFFPAPPVPLADAKAKCDALDVAIQDATDGSKAQKALRDEKAKEVADILRAYAHYQRLVANGDSRKLTTGGFEMAKEPELITVIAIPKNVRASATHISGQALLRWGKTKGARMFKVERAISDPTLGEPAWESLGFTSLQRFVAAGLEPYQAYWFRVIAIGKEKEGLPSTVVLGRAV